MSIDSGGFEKEISYSCPSIFWMRRRVLPFWCYTCACLFMDLYAFVVCLFFFCLPWIAAQAAVAFTTPRWGKMRPSWAGTWHLPAEMSTLQVSASDTSVNGGQLGRPEWHLWSMTCHLAPAWLSLMLRSSRDPWATPEQFSFFSSSSWCELDWGRYEDCKIPHI